MTDDQFTKLYQLSQSLAQYQSDSLAVGKQLNTFAMWEFIALAFIAGAMLFGLILVPGLLRRQL